MISALEGDLCKEGGEKKSMLLSDEVLVCEEEGVENKDDGNEEGGLSGIIALEEAKD